jgi:lactate dehydrogenase-like 2-hydroxyacid dehydrogenase
MHCVAVIDANHPLLAPKLQNKVLIWPHSGSAELATRLNMCEMAARNVLAGLGLLEEAKSILPPSVWKTRRAFEAAEDSGEDEHALQPDYSTHFV